MLFCGSKNCPLTCLPLLCSGVTPLMLSSFFGHASTSRALLLLGASARAADARGFTPLHAAAQEGRMEAAQALLEDVRGADGVDDANGDGSTPLLMSVFAEDLEMATLLVQNVSPH